MEEERYVEQGEFDVQGAHESLVALRPALLLLDACYLLFVWKLAPRLRGLKTDPRLLRDLSIVWNGFNALTSAYMCTLLLPELLAAMRQGGCGCRGDGRTRPGYYFTACKVGDFYTSPASGRAMYLFCLSKIWELGDTVLLALRGRDIIFLHYFHHSVVLIQVVFTYHNAGESGRPPRPARREAGKPLSTYRMPRSASGSMARLGTNMNSFVHALMYSYFALMNLVPGIRGFAPVITCLQMAQFVVACVGMLSLVGYLLAGQECETDKLQLPVHFFVYVVFFVLFAHFFQQSYGKKSPRAKSAVSLGRAKQHLH